MDYLSLIKAPIVNELDDFIRLFNSSLTHDGELQEEIFARIRERAGKRMRPMLILLMAKAHGGVNASTLNAAVGLELLHTASLVHDDVVDESGERRGQASVNALYDNKIAVLVGDYILSTALLHVAMTENNTIVKYLAELGRTLSNGEILQLTNISNDDISEDVYFQVIRQKTAALFEACCSVGALSAGASPEDVDAARRFGQDMGVIFQIRDDIFDYYESSAIGKPTGNDMAEGKLTLPVIHTLNSGNDDSMLSVARKVKRLEATKEDIAVLVEYAKSSGGIEYAERKMEELRVRCVGYIESVVAAEDIKKALGAYLEFVIRRDL
ncbi:polyprenyl synthetase family protein [Prevotella sp. PCHR]|uniref:Polyprenyl synthetase family protein n=1 Tax=Xylanibacter caecicola TaxID=2736294 RepID=A0ABX2AY95_9BACT|nr:polyprenyl synthetase family protein [Xylanibacter caecicola]NPE23946.1 polyprenyl synthetase family protein [Xylanibacter caecicola]